MRILLVSNLFPPDVLGGYELLAADVAASLRDRGHDVHVLTTGAARLTDPRWVHRKLHLVRPFSEAAALDGVRRALHARVQQSAADGLLAEGFDGAVVMSLRRLGIHVPRALERAGIPTVYCFNDDWLLAHRPGVGRTARRAVWSALERVALGAHTWRGVSIDRAVYLSAAIRTGIRDGGARVPEGAVCLHGVDRKMFHPRAVRPVGAAPKLLYAGRIHPTKGVDVAIMALGRLRRRGMSATLTIAGAGDREELARLSAIVRAESVTPFIDWRGFVERHELGDVYREHDAFLFPSLWEDPAGLNYLEAMACGVPVVAIARGGANELLRHEVNALVADDADTMAAAIARLGADDALVETIVRGGATTVHEQASLERYVCTIESELQRDAESAA